MKPDILSANDPTSNNKQRKDFNSKWEFIKSFSRWHFDKWRKEENPYNVFMNVSGDWAQELDTMEYEICVGLDNYVHGGQKGDGLIEKDWLKWGYREDMEQYDRTYQIPPKLVKLAEQLKLKHPDIRIHRQRPGQVAPIHADAYCSHPAIHDNPELNVADMRRFLIQLTDWDWGHFWSFGNSVWKQWRAGDFVYFESRDVIHSTANAGKVPRVTMVVTGWMSEETKALISGQRKQFKLSSSGLTEDCV